MCGCVALSYFYEKNQKNKIKYLIKMRDFVMYVRTKIELFLTPRSKLFVEYNDDCIKSVLNDDKDNLSRYFDKRDSEYICAFLESLGKGMKDEELSLCDYTISRLSDSIEKSESELKNKIKVFRTLAIFGGASLIILII